MKGVQFQGLKGFSIDYWLLITGDFVSKMGSNIFGWAISLYILKSTGSSMALGFTLALMTLPPVLISTIGGVYVDRYSKKMFIVGTDIIRGILFMIFAYLSWKNNLTPTLIYIFVFVEGIFKAIFRPAVFAAMPLLVKGEKILQAKAFNQSMTNLSIMSTPILASIFFRKYGIFVISLVNAFSFIFSAISEMFIHIPEKKLAKGEKVYVKRDLKESFQILSQLKVLFVITVMLAFTNLISVPLNMTLPMSLIQGSLRLGETEWGIFRTIFVMGGFCGATFNTFFKTRWTTYKSIFIGMVIHGVIYAGMGATVNFYLILIISFLNGLVTSIVNINLSTLTTRISPREHLGKISGLTSAISNFFNPVSYILGSFIAEIIGVRRVYILFGWLYVAVVILFLGRQSIQREAQRTVNF
ncbi:MAG: MFS transporter [Halanaerobiales bacterium]|nr:MFS transporter [Halanaerobiales bacterium]